MSESDLCIVQSAFKCSQTLVVTYDECASFFMSSLFQRGADVLLNAKKRTRTCEYHKKGLRNPAVDQTPIEEIQRGRRNGGSFNTTIQIHRLKRRRKEYKNRNQKVWSADFSQEDRPKYDGRLSHVSFWASDNPCAKVREH